MTTCISTMLMIGIVFKNLDMAGFVCTEDVQGCNN